MWIYNRLFLPLVDLIHEGLSRLLCDGDDLSGKAHTSSHVKGWKIYNTSIIERYIYYIPNIRGQCPIQHRYASCPAQVNLPLFILPSPRPSLISYYYYYLFYATFLSHEALCSFTINTAGPVTLSLPSFQSSSVLSLRSNYLLICLKVNAASTKGLSQERQKRRMADMKVGMSVSVWVVVLSSLRLIHFAQY